MEAVMENMTSTLEEYNNQEIEELPCNIHALEAYPIREAETFTEYDEETGEEIEIEGEEHRVGTGYLITWGGPEARIYTKDEGATWRFFYCDWGGSDSFDVRITGRDLETVQGVFGWIEEERVDQIRLDSWRS